jgi:hypothetical protein
MDTSSDNDNLGWVNDQFGENTHEEILSQETEEESSECEHTCEYLYEG